MGSVVKIDHVTKSYGKNRGVADVSLEIQEGDIFGFLGPNGAGKSTIIRSMLGFLNTSMAGATSRFITYDLGLDNAENLKQTFNAAFQSHLVPLFLS